MQYKQTSQYGECKILHALFSNSSAGYFIDIGAADGIRYSNTFNLIEAGWSGILVEPCKHFLSTLHKNNSDNPNVHVFAGGISNFDGTTKFYVWKEGGDSQISTIIEQQYEEIKNDEWWKKEGQFTDEYDVDILKPTTFLNKFKVPKQIEFVDIDAEGSEMDILESWPWNDYNVQLFCIEFSMGKDFIINYMKQKNYVPIAQTGGNLLFCKPEQHSDFLSRLEANLKGLGNN